MDSLPTAVAPAAASPGPGTAGRKILVVDDNADAAYALGLLLGLEGYEVETAHDGEAAVDAVRRAPPDVVLMDLGMPRLDGYAAARLIRADAPDILLVALTGWDQQSDRTRAREAGFDHHFAKPVDADKLFALLARP